jgi:UDP-glucose 4-epimerase
LRDYIHVNDLADAHLRALEHLDKGGASFAVNLGTGKGHSVLEVIQAAEKITGRKVNYQAVGRRDGDPEALWATGEKAKTLLGWVPKHSSIECIVETTWNAYQANGLVK